MIRILLADDDKFIRRTLCSYLESEPDIEIVATADNGKTALQLISELNPDLAFLDIEMPKIDGLTATEIIVKQYPQTKAVVLSSYDDREYVNKAIEAGAIGYLLKTITAEELSQAIRFLHKGYLQLAPGLSHKLSPISSKTIETGKNSALISPVFASSPAKLVTQTARSSNISLYNALDDFIPIFNRRTNIGGMILLGILGITVIMTNIPKSKAIVKSPALVSSAGQLYPIQTTIEGNIKDIKVTEDKLVKAGEVIATIEDSQLQSQKQQLQENRKLSKIQIDAIEAKIIDLNTQIVAENRIIDRILVTNGVDSYFDRQVDRNKDVSSQAELQKIREEIQLAKEDIDIYQKLELKGIIARSQVQKKENALKTAQAKLLKVQASSYLSHRDESRDETREQKLRERIQRQALKDSLEREKKALKDEKNTLYKQLNIYTQELQKLETNLKKAIVRAPFTGIIQKLDSTKKGQFIQPGKIIAEIVPTQAPLVVRTLISARDIDKIQIGQIAKLSVDDCQNSSQTKLEGTVSSIVPYLGKSQQQAKANKLNTESRIYEVKIQPKNSLPTSDRVLSKQFSERNKCLFQVGMKGNVEIIARQETLLNFLFNGDRK
jgi:DNA-binding NarL/FixJ family response regulator/multidrug efflux pump subunit AcrA (membrane-fusion protein)